MSRWMVQTDRGKHELLDEIELRATNVALRAERDNALAAGARGERTAKDIRMKKVQNETLDLIVVEVEFARTKFPGGKVLLAALTEEVGELAKALLQKRGRSEVVKEAVQVAAMAVRIIEEGCPEFDDLTAEESKE